MDGDYKKYTSYFSSEKFWQKIKEFPKKIGLAGTAYALILYYILQKKEVPMSDKLLIMGSLGYFILPLDLVPDLIPIAGYTDDITGMVFAIKKCSTYIDSEVKRNVSDKLIDWFKIDKNYIDKLIDEIA